MNQNDSNAAGQTIDTTFVALVVSQVIARLKAQSNANQTNTGNSAVVISDHVVTAATIEKIPGTPSEIFVNEKSIVTPAARDEAKLRGMTINRSVTVPPAQTPSHPNSHHSHNKQTNNPALEIIDRQDADRSASIKAQLSRRGVTSLNDVIILSDTPAAEVYQQCHSGRRAAMLGAIADVDRFVVEMKPNVWVLDMKRMNLIAAVNVIVRISNQ